jgi:hypothetical protein
MLTLGLLLFPCGSSRASESRYPNELAQFKFYESARWNVIEPFVSTQKDVFALLGLPKRVFYEFGDAWNLIVLYTDSGECDGKPWPSFLSNTVAHIDLIPKNRLSLSDVRFPNVFEKRESSSAHAAAPWYVYKDSYGLEYHVFYTDSRDKAIHAGDLMEIVYGPSRKTYTTLTGCDE